MSEAVLAQAQVSADRAGRSSWGPRDLNFIDSRAHSFIILAFVPTPDPDAGFGHDLDA